MCEKCGKKPATRQGFVSDLLRQDELEEGANPTIISPEEVEPRAARLVEEARRPQADLKRSLEEDVCESGDGKVVTILIPKKVSTTGIEVEVHGDDPKDICILCEKRERCDGSQLHDCAIPCG